MGPRNRRNASLIGWSSIVIGLALVIAMVNYHQLLGWWREWHYQPPLAIQEIVANDHLTDRARHLFYQAAPQIDTDRSAFEAHCQAPVSSKTVELGCYTPDGRIYLLDLGDSELSDIINVTAAHELLHAAYGELGPAKKHQMNQWVEAEVATLNNAELAGELKNYSLSEPGQRDNELHSLLGSEYQPLSNDLEQYYSQFFAERSKIVAYNDSFNQTFRSLESEMDTLSSQIDSLKSRMQQLSAEKDYSAYNALVPTVNALIVRYNADVIHYNNLSRTLRGSENSLPNQ